MLFLLDLNTNTIELQGVEDEDGAAVTGATVTVTMYDASNVAVVGQSWPTTMSYVTGSATGTNGATYRARISAAITWDRTQLYTADVTATSGGATGRWKPVVRVEPRLDE